MSTPPPHILAALRLGEPAVVAPAPPGEGTWSVTVAGTLLGHVRPDSPTTWCGYPALPLVPPRVLGLSDSTLTTALMPHWMSVSTATKALVAATTGVYGARVVEEP